MAGMKQWLIGVGDALSQFGNVALLNGHPNESICGRAWRTQSGWYKVIDLLLWFDKDHCKTAYGNDYKYAKEYVKQYESRLPK